MERAAQVSSANVHVNVFADTKVMTMTEPFRVKFKVVLLLAELERAEYSKRANMSFASPQFG
jgi:DNA invertase Pin-like site-specific DNA recombinase